MISATAMHEINTMISKAATGCRRIMSAKVRFVALYVVYCAARSPTRFSGIAYIAFVRIPASA